MTYLKGFALCRTPMIKPEPVRVSGCEEIVTMGVIEREDGSRVVEWVRGG